MPTIVLDWDGTVFDTSRFKKDWFEVLETVTGVDPSETYEEVKNLCGFYEVDFHLKRLQRGSAVPMSTLYLGAELFLKRQSGNYIFPDAFKFLKTIPRDTKVVVLTKGTEWFQKMKIAYSGIANLFDGIFVAEDSNKLEVLRGKVFPKGIRPFIFVDDSGDEVDLVAELSAEHGVVPVQIVRGGGKKLLSEKAVKTVSYLTEVSRFFFFQGEGGELDAYPSSVDERE